MKKILLSVGVIAIVAIGAIGATRAYFSDTETISGNTFTSGTLALQIDSNTLSSAQTWADGFTSPAKFTNLYPGFTDEQIIDVKNNGSINGVATIDLNRTSSWSDLAGVLNFKVFYKAEGSTEWINSGLNGTVDQYTQSYNLGSMSAGSVMNIKIVWTVPTPAGNEIQGDAVTMNAVFGLTQEVK